MNHLILMYERQSRSSVFHDAPNLFGALERGDDLRIMISVNVLLEVEIAQLHIDKEEVRTW
jgi:hypothetical protein